MQSTVKQSHGRNKFHRLLIQRDRRMIERDVVDDPCMDGCRDDNVRRTT